MIHFDLPRQKSSIIKVLGVGGGGSNAVNFMFDQQIEGVDFIICNTDAKAIEQSPVPNKIQLGPHLTQGLLEVVAFPTFGGYLGSIMDCCPLAILLGDNVS